MIFPDHSVFKDFGKFYIYCLILTQMVFKVGIAGLGNIGFLHAQVFDTLEDVQSIQVADPNRSRDHFFQSLSKKDTFFNDFKDLESCDCVIIALPTKLHSEAVSYFSSWKIPMLIEKPLGLTYEESKEIVKQVRDVPSMCGLTGLYHPEFRAMYEQLPTIGNLISVDESLHEANPDLARVLAENQGVLTISGIHTLHRFHKIASLIDNSKALEIESILLDHRSFMLPGEDIAKGTLYMGSVPFTFDMSFRNNRKCDNGLPTDYILKIKGTKGTINVTGWEKCETYYNDGRAFINYNHPNGSLGTRSHYPRISLGLRTEIQEFVNLLKTGERNHHTLEEALAGQKLIEDCYDKAKN
jgi:predicted dehydrogenase